MKTCIIIDAEWLTRHGPMAFPITLQQRGRDSFRVIYGRQIDDHLIYADAAKKLGQAIMHALACDGMLDNGQ